MKTSLFIKLSILNLCVFMLSIFFILNLTIPKGYDLLGEEVEYTDLEELQALFNQISRAKYDNETYNCANYSQDLYLLAKNSGYNIEKVYGCTDREGVLYCHSYNVLELPIEPIIGKIALEYESIFNISRTVFE